MGEVKTIEVEELLGRSPAAPLEPGALCDRHPSAEAYVRVRGPRSDSTIDLCAHCYRVHELALAVLGWEVYDNRFKLSGMYAALSPAGDGA